MGTLHHTFPLHRLGKLPRIACIAAASVAACGEGASENTGLPFSYTRPERGEPGTHAEVAEVTGLLREGLAHTRYFEFPEARAHGWPQRDPKGRYWYGTEWSGVAIVRTGTSVVLDHPEDGSDNNGLRTAPVLAGACFAHALHPSDELDHLVRKLIRGMSSWILAMERSSTPGAPTLLARAAYPEPVEWELNGLRIRADYSDQRPGVDNEVSEYVHIADNPHWGDVWVKSKRSKDDIGHMLRVMAELESCRAQCPRNARRLRRHARALSGVGASCRRRWLSHRDLRQGPRAVRARSIACRVHRSRRNRVQRDADALAVRTRRRERRDCGYGVSDGDRIAIAAVDHNRHIIRASIRLRSFTACNRGTRRPRDISSAGSRGEFDEISIHSNAARLPFTTPRRS